MNIRKRKNPGKLIKILGMIIGIIGVIAAGGIAFAAYKCEESLLLYAAAEIFILFFIGALLAYALGEIVANTSDTAAYLEFLAQPPTSINGVVAHPPVQMPVVPIAPVQMQSEPEPAPEVDAPAEDAPLTPPPAMPSEENVPPAQMTPPPTASAPVDDEPETMELTSAANAFEDDPQTALLTDPRFQNEPNVMPPLPETRHDVSNQARTCSICGTIYMPGQNFCNYCGSQIK